MLSLDKPMALVQVEFLKGSRDSIGSKNGNAYAERSPSLAEWLSTGMAAIPRLAALARNDTSPVIPSEGAKRRSRGIAIVLAEWLSSGMAALPRLAALARNDTS